MEKYFRFGQVLKPQGIKGELKLKTFTDDLSRVGDIDHIYLKKGDEYERRSVSGARTYKQFVYLKIEGIPDRNEAETYRNRVIYIERGAAAGGRCLYSGYNRRQSEHGQGRGTGRADGCAAKRRDRRICGQRREGLYVSGCAACYSEARCRGGSDSRECRRVGKDSSI